MATKPKKINSIGDLSGLGATYQAFGSGSGLGSSVGGRLPAASSYTPYQPETPGYEEGGISAGDISQLPSINMDASQAAPNTLTSAERRTRARQNYSFDVGDVNRRLQQAAMQYGNAPKVTQYGVDDSVSDMDVTADPNSVWSNIGRYYGENDRNINEDLNNRGSFFSGANLERHGKLSDEVNRQRGTAANDFSNTLADLNSLIMRSRGQRDADMRSADIEDMLAAAAGAQAIAAPTGGAPAAPDYSSPVWSDANDTLTLDDGSGNQVPWYDSPAAMGPAPSTGGSTAGGGLGALAGMMTPTKKKR